MPTAQPPATGAAILSAIHDQAERLSRIESALERRSGALTLAAEIASRIFVIEDHLRGLVERMERIENVATHRHKIADKRADRVDKYVLDDAFNLDATNKQLIEVFNALRTEILDLRRTLKHESDTTRKAVALSLSDPGNGAGQALEHGRG
jgi:Zn-dependent M32 family carboxypeptidase